MNGLSKSLYNDGWNSTSPDRLPVSESTSNLPTPRTSQSRVTAVYPSSSAHSPPSGPSLILDPLLLSLFLHPVPNQALRYLIHQRGLGDYLLVAAPLVHNTSTAPITAGQKLARPEILLFSSTIASDHHDRTRGSRGRSLRRPVRHPTLPSSEYHLIFVLSSSYDADDSANHPVSTNAAPANVEPAPASPPRPTTEHAAGENVTGNSSIQAYEHEQRPTDYNGSFQNAAGGTDVGHGGDAPGTPVGPETRGTGIKEDG